MPQTPSPDCWPDGPPWRRWLRRPPDMPAALRRLIDQVPLGRVTTYGDLAAALGLSAASRWVGQWMMDHPHEPDCRCHRVLRATGKLGLYIGGGADRKRQRLEKEGVAVLGDQVELERYRYVGLRGSSPLARLVDLQLEMSRCVRVEPLVDWPEHIGGVDISPAGGRWAVAAYVLVERASGRLVWSATVGGQLAFPYIPSLLSFREAPLLLRLLEQVKSAGRLTTPVLVDGSGVLHPRRSGIASLVGVALDWPTLGVTKKHLCGTLGGAQLKMGSPQPVWIDQQVAGIAALPPSGSQRPIYVSPGHRADVTACQRVALELMAGRRLPGPIYWADRISRQAAARRGRRGSAERCPD